MKSEKPKATSINASTASTPGIVNICTCGHNKSTHRVILAGNPNPVCVMPNCSCNQFRQSSFLVPQVNHQRQDWQWAVIAVGAIVAWVSLFLQATYSLGLFSR